MAREYWRRAALSIAAARPGGPPENVVAMLEAVNEYGAYPLA